MSEYSRWMEKAHVAGTWPPEHRSVAIVTGPTGSTQSGSVGQVLTCTNQTNGWTNSPTSYAYQWVRGYVPWTNIGTNASTYTLVALDSGNPIRCVVSAVNAAGTTVGPPSNWIACA